MPPSCRSASTAAQSESQRGNVRSARIETEEVGVLAHGPSGRNEAAESSASGPGAPDE